MAAFEEKLITDQDVCYVPCQEIFLEDVKPS
jgi:hypothetical protein